MQNVVLSSLEEFWPSDKEVEKKSIYIGAWCFAFNKKHSFLELKKFNVIESPWKLFGGEYELKRAQEYLDVFSWKIVKILTEGFNEIYKVEKSEMFWNSILTFWLTHWLDVYYESYLRISRFRDDGANYYFRMISNYREFLNTETQWDFLKIIHRPETIHSVFSELLVLVAGDNFELSREFLDCKKHYVDEVNHSFLGRFFFVLYKKLKFNIVFVKYLLQKLLRILNFAKKSEKNKLPAKKISIVEIWELKGAEHSDVIDLKERYGSAELLEVANGTQLTGGREKLKHSFGQSFIPENLFEDLVAKIIVENLPEEFFNLSVPSQSNRKQLRLGHPSGTVEDAENLENGGRHYSIQHGGGYGIYNVFPMGKIEYELPGRFLSWGWSFHHNYNAIIVPMPSPHINKLKRNPSAKNNRIIYVGNSWPVSPFRLQSAANSDQMFDYFNDKIIFFNALNHSVANKFLYKMGPVDYGVDELKILKNNVRYRIKIKNFNLIDYMQVASLIVIDHNATSYIEALSMNCPTILFWNPRHVEYHEKAQPIFDGLRKAGILFDSETSAMDAAETINSITDNIEGWWLEPVRQRAVKDFVDFYIMKSDNWKRDWQEFIQKEIIQINAG